MTKYNRITGKVFGATASATGDNPEIGQFGSAKEGSYIGTSDISTIQALPAWGQGWAGAVTPETNFPPLPEMTGAMKVLSQQQCYLLQQGLAEWDSATIYYTNNFSAKNGKIYISLTNENQGNDPETDKVNWKEFSAGGGLELCDIGMALYVDETKGLRRYLNGQIVDINTNTQAFLNRLKEITTLHPSLLCTEEEWQTAKTMSAFGQVGKFVFNYSGADIVSVRLPRVVNVQGLFDLQNLGMTVGAGLPDHTHTYIDYYAAFTQGHGGEYPLVADRNINNTKTTAAASLSNPIYGNSDTVQQEAIQYPYFIQIATGSETENNIINEIELNNPYSLFDSKYSDHELNNLSWLKSSGQWNAKAVYPTAYDKLLKVYNGTETVVGLSVKLSTEEYTDYDFVLNTAEEIFRLPLLDGSENLIGDKYTSYEIGASGKEYTATHNGYVSVIKSVNKGLVNLYNSTQGHSNTTCFQFYASTNDTVVKMSIKVNRGDKFIFQYTAPTTNSYSSMILRHNKGNGSLYFYVGETVQNANLINAGRIGEQLATKTDMLQASGAGMPDYSRIEAKSFETSYQAECDGYIYAVGESGPTKWLAFRYSLDGTFKDLPLTNMNNCVTTIGNVGGNQQRTALMIPCPKGIYYRVEAIYGAVSGLWFIKAKGAQ